MYFKGIITDSLFAQFLWGIIIFFEFIFFLSKNIISISKVLGASWKDRFLPNFFSYLCIACKNSNAQRSVWRRIIPFKKSLCSKKPNGGFFKRGEVLSKVNLESFLKHKINLSNIFFVSPILPPTPIVTLYFLFELILKIFGKFDV